jgi:hypothetical protein
MGKMATVSKLMLMKKKTELVNDLNKKEEIQDKI